MITIDRSNFFDAKIAIEEIINDINARLFILKIFHDSILLASSIDNSNWNINLELNGKILRFNVGQEYCLQVFQDEFLALVLRAENSGELQLVKDKMLFRGHIKKKRIESMDPFEPPDCLAKTKSSIACIIPPLHVPIFWPTIKKLHQSFIKLAINKTKLLTTSMSAHSPGVISFINYTLGADLPNPSYATQDHQCHSKTFKPPTIEELLKRIALSKKSVYTKYSTTAHYRNPLIAQLALLNANGICCDCKKPAPFISRFTNQPYLESHHNLPFSEGGLDEPNNVIALCPNCHRKRHYGVEEK